MRIKKTMMMLCAALLLGSSPCMAEDMKFVDADGMTGYYVDVDSLTFENDSVVNARIAVKKPAMNRMFLYTMRFDVGMRTYQTLASEVLQYDPRKVLESKGGTDVSHPYGLTSPMNSIVEFIYEWRDRSRRIVKPD